MAKLVLTRKSSMLNRRQQFRIFVDGVETGHVKNGDTQEFELPAGPHSLQCKVGWMSSPVETVQIKESSNTYLSVTNAAKFIVPLYFLMLAGVLLPFFFSIAKAPVPDFVNILKPIMIFPAIGYYIFYISFYRKKFLLISDDKSNPFN